jgi:hypothetical protein
LKHKELITNEDQENIFNEYWEVAEHNRLVAYLSTLIITN